MSDLPFTFSGTEQSQGMNGAPASPYGGDSGGGSNLSPYLAAQMVGSPMGASVGMGLPGLPGTGSSGGGLANYDPALLAAMSGNYLFAGGGKVSRPTMAVVGEGAAPEYVIPTDPKYRQRAKKLLKEASSKLKGKPAKKQAAPPPEPEPEQVPGMAAGGMLGGQSWQQLMPYNYATAFNLPGQGQQFHGTAYQYTPNPHYGMPGAMTQTPYGHQWGQGGGTPSSPPTFGMTGGGMPNVPNFGHYWQGLPGQSAATPLFSTAKPQALFQAMMPYAAHGWGGGFTGYGLQQAQDAGQTWASQLGNTPHMAGGGVLGRDTGAMTNRPQIPPPGPGAGVGQQITPLPGGVGQQAPGAGGQANYNLPGALPFPNGSQGVGAGINALGNAYGMDLSGLASGYGSAYNAALQANQTNYNNILGGYQQLGQNLQGQQKPIAQGYQNLAGQVQNTLGFGGTPWGIAQPAAQAIADVYAQQRGANTQGAISRGLGNSTVVDSLQRGSALDAAKAYGALGSNLAQTYAGYQSQLGLAGLGYQNQAVQQQQQLGQNQLAFQNSVQAPYPNAQAYAQLAGQAGAGKQWQQSFQQSQNQFQQQMALAQQQLAQQGQLGALGLLAHGGLGGGYGGLGGGQGLNALANYPGLFGVGGFNKPLPGKPGGYQYPYAGGMKPLGPQASGFGLGTSPSFDPSMFGGGMGGGMGMDPLVYQAMTGVVPGAPFAPPGLGLPQNAQILPNPPQPGGQGGQVAPLPQNNPKGIENDPEIAALAAAANNPFASGGQVDPEMTQAALGFGPFGGASMDWLQGYYS